jgi:hypothetical protein
LKDKIAFLRSFWGPPPDSDESFPDSPSRKYLKTKIQNVEIITTRTLAEIETFKPDKELEDPDGFDGAARLFDLRKTCCPVSLSNSSALLSSFLVFPGQNHKPLP